MNDLIIKFIIACCTTIILFPILLKYITYVLKNDIKYLKEECEELNKLLKEKSKIYY